MRAALVDDVGRVINVVLVEDSYEPPTGLTVHPVDDTSPVGADWRRDGEGFVPPAPALPGPPPPPTGAWAAGADARIAALSAAMAAVMKTTTLPDVDDDVLGELDGLNPLPPTGGGQDLDDILSELEGL